MKVYQNLWSEVDMLLILQDIQKKNTPKMKSMLNPINLESG
ncbi:uncharacterized protein METZ01_LOCUS410468 [marine metagenome]|uniref:Uncharacterized protein n=1 Tax=marine metagenome TaxID=408172 RepID=A0A382WG80_9ZZZZ